MDVLSRGFFDLPGKNNSSPLRNPIAEVGHLNGKEVKKVYPKNGQSAGSSEGSTLFDAGGTMFPGSIRSPCKTACSTGSLSRL
jgi:hypothetical protein